MKQFLLLLTLHFVTGNIHAEEIKTRTTLITMVGDCMVFQTTFWGDNNTPTISTDDRYLGVDYLMDCPDNKTAPGFVPDFTHPYFYPRDAEAFQKFSFAPDGKILLPAFVGYIPYEEYLSRIQQKQAKISALPAKEVPNVEPPGIMRIIKQE
jgi:hypothetical protein